MTNDELRQAFEVFILSAPRIAQSQIDPLRRNPDGSYLFWSINGAWEGFQAGHALAQQQAMKGDNG